MYDPERHVAIIGGGPAGLTAAFLLAQEGWDVSVLESDPRHLGGISRTVEYKGFRFDIGGHRFFSKSAEVENFWSEIMGEDMLDRPRLSRIYYRGQFFQYPLKAMEALTKLGIIESALCVLSYCKAKLFPRRDPKSFEDWVINQFGARLFGIFFKTYTEKVWGMSCKEISADWAAQRIKGLSLASAIRNAIWPSKPARGDRSKVIKTLIDTFRYPRLGPGMMWERCGERIRAMGGEIHMGCTVESISFHADGATWTLIARSRETGSEVRLRAAHVISSADIRALGKMLRPALPEPAAMAAKSLRYRDFITVALMVRGCRELPDNWIYIHDPGVKAGRIQNFKSWSPSLVPDPAMACYGLEYFCFEGDGLWATSDEELIALAARDLESVGLARQSDVVDGYVVRQPKAYPVYDDDYAKHVETFRLEIERGYPGLHLVGRNGMHKYNNQDHAMMTAMLTARNIIAGEPVYDVWKVNQDAEYHEAGNAAQEGSGATGLRLVPRRIPLSPQTAQQLANLHRNVADGRGPKVAVVARAGGSPGVSNDASEEGPGPPFAA